MKNPKHIPKYSHREFQNRFTQSTEFPVGGTEEFRIYKIQDVIKYLKFPLPLQRSDYFEILFISSGSTSSRNCGLKKYDINPRQLFFKPAGQISSGDIYDTDIEGYFCLLEGGFLSKYSMLNSSLTTFSFFKYRNSPLIDLSIGETEKFDTLFRSIHALCINPNPANNQLVAAYVNVLFQEASLLHQKQENINDSRNVSSQQQLISKFLDLINEHYLTKQQVNEYAEMLHVTPDYLNKSVKQVTGETALQQIHKMLILEAKVLLKHSEMNISEVADYLNFEGLSYFARFFKKHTSYTPLKYRKSE